MRKQAFYLAVFLLLIPCACTVEITGDDREEDTPLGDSQLEDSQSEDIPVEDAHREDPFLDVMEIEMDTRQEDSHESLSDDSGLDPGDSAVDSTEDPTEEPLDLLDAVGDERHDADMVTSEEAIAPVVLVGFEEYDFEGPGLPLQLTDLVQAYRTGGMALAEEFASVQGLDFEEGAIDVMFHAPLEKRGGVVTLSALIDVGAVELGQLDNVHWLSVPIEGLNQLVEQEFDDYGSIKQPKTPYYDPFGNQDIFIEPDWGLVAMGINGCHNKGFDGYGSKVAVLDVGFIDYHDARDQGLLPDDVELVQDITDVNGTWWKDEHGTAVAEIVHRTAPEAKLYLVMSRNDFQVKEAVDWCIDNDIDVINASWSNLWHSFYDGTGKISELAAKAWENGIVWVNASGNYADGHHWQGTWKDDDDNDIMEFAPGDESNDILLVDPQQIKIYLNWNDWQDELYQLGICIRYTIYNPADPQETLIKEKCNNFSTSPSLSVELTVWNEHYCQQDPDKYWCIEPEIEVFIMEAGAPIPDGLEVSLFIPSYLDQPMEYWMPEQSVADPAVREEIITVGAIHPDGWPDVEAIEYSSYGPTNAGVLKPEICAPSSVDSFIYDPAFTGTSAAAPYVAGAAAVLLEQYPFLTPDEVKQFFIDHAVANGPVPNQITGYGQIHYDCSVCVPDCHDRECGPDGCESSCGLCPNGFVCADGQCMEEGVCPQGCDDENECTDDVCLVDGCHFPDVLDGSPCLGGEHFSCLHGTCICTPNCNGRNCGSNGCLGSCGECEQQDVCLDSGVCCSLECDGKQCGSDGCGGVCGECDDGYHCVDGLCDDCDDGNPCTDDRYERGVGCVNDFHSRSCDDGVFCNGFDTCQDGICAEGIALDCSGLNDSCNVGECDEQEKDCVVTPRQDGVPCDDGAFCNGTDTCQNGVCQVDTDVDCTTLDDDCNVGVCDDDDDQCVREPKENGTDCDDGVNCNGVDTCIDGVCQLGEAVDCSHLNDECNDGVCFEGDGQCVKVPRRDGASCDDLLFCNGTDTCQNGVCQVGTDVDCSDLDDECNVGVCDDDDDQCVESPKQDGTSCGLNMVCLLGSCIADTSCDDGNRIDWDGCTDGEHSEIQLNNYTAGNQWDPSISSFSDGGFVAVWTSENQDGNGYEIYGRLFDAQGLPRADEFRVNDHIVGEQLNPDVMTFAGGEFAVAWAGHDSGDAQYYGIMVRLYDSWGQAFSEEFNVQLYSGNHDRPTIEAVDTDTFILAWEAMGTGITDIYHRQYDVNWDTGVATTSWDVGTVNTILDGRHSRAGVSIISTGGFVVTFTNCPWPPDGAGTDGSGCGVYARAFDANGLGLAPEGLINETTDNDQWASSIASFGNDQGMIVWHNKVSDFSWNIHGRKADSNGMLDGGEFRVNTVTEDYDLFPDVSGRPQGGLVVGWEAMSTLPGGAYQEIFAQLYDSSGVSQGGQIPVNVFRQGVQRDTHVSMVSVGGFVIVWESCPEEFEPIESGQDGNGCGVFVSRFDAQGLIRPVGQ